MRGISAIVFEERERETFGQNFVSPSSYLHTIDIRSSPFGVLSKSEPPISGRNEMGLHSSLQQRRPKISATYRYHELTASCPVICCYLHGARSETISWEYICMHYPFYVKFEENKYFHIPERDEQNKYHKKLTETIRISNT